MDVRAAAPQKCRLRPPILHPSLHPQIPQAATQTPSTQRRLAFWGQGHRQAACQPRPAAGAYLHAVLNWVSFLWLPLQITPDSKVKTTILFSPSCGARSGKSGRSPRGHKHRRLGSGLTSRCDPCRGSWGHPSCLSQLLGAKGVPWPERPPLWSRGPLKSVSRISLGLIAPVMAFRVQAHHPPSP